MSKEVVLAIRDLTVALPAWADRKEAVQSISLDLHHNEVLCVVGESGSGKSVMGRAIMGLLAKPHVRATNGQIIFEEEDLLAVNERRMREIRGNRIGMIFQEPMTALNPMLTIGEQIDELLELHRHMPFAERKALVLDRMQEVHLPEPERIYDSFPHQLSGGQRQRAMIVMALLLEPGVLIADEPTTALDVTTQAQILTLIKELQRKRETGVVFITHDFGVVAEIADRVAVMQFGKLVEVGTVRQILEDPQHPYTKSLIAAVPSLEPPNRLSREGGETILKVSGVSKSYGPTPTFWRRKVKVKPALDNVSLQVKRGEILGLVGESGSGKSTLARCIVQLSQVDNGSVELAGVDLARLTATRLRETRRHVQMIFQDPYGSLNPRLTVAQLITQGPMAQGVSRKEAESESARLLELVRLDASAAHRYPHEFSGGQRQRIGIARALAMKPSVLVADEPVSALDVSVQKSILELLLDIRERLGVAMLFVTHDLRVAAQLCDRLAVMHQGQVVEQGVLTDIYSNPKHPYTQSLLRAVPGRDWKHQLAG